MYYSDKLDKLKDIFGTDEVYLEEKRILVNGQSYPVVNDVIILLDYWQYPSSLKKALESYGSEIAGIQSDFAEDIQFTFGEEWQRFPHILPEHESEFEQYFDLIDIGKLKSVRVCDLGCGIGRWSFFLASRCRELVLVDFSEAIFVARQNLSQARNTLFFMGDLKRLPFRENFADFLFCLGVLHHLPTDALDEVRNLKRYSPVLSIYLYYSLDNRAFYFRLLFGAATALRSVVSKVRNPVFRSVFTWFAGALFYQPFIFLGTILKPVGLSKYVPIYEGYSGKSRQRICQDVYDRFFTRIEQRFSRRQIMGLRDHFSRVEVSDGLPYWHFICVK